MFAGRAAAPPALRAQLGFPFFPKLALGGFRLEQRRFRAARRQSDARVGARVADHHLAEQPAQFLRLAGLTRALRVHEPRAKFLWRGQLSRLQERDEVVKFFERILHRRRREQQQESPWQGVHGLPGLRFAVPQVMRFVHDDQVPRNPAGDFQVRRLFDRVQAGNDARILAPEL